jgi:hypothetical protein
MAENLWKLTTNDPPLVHADGRKRRKLCFLWIEFQRKAELPAYRCYVLITLYPLISLAPCCITDRTLSHELQFPLYTQYLENIIRFNIINSKEKRGEKFWDELITPTFLQIYQSNNTKVTSKVIINTREKNVYFLAPTTAAFSHGMLPLARASRDADMLQVKTKEPFQNSSVGIVTRLHAGIRRDRSSIIGRGTFVTSQRVQARFWVSPPQIHWVPGGDPVGKQI